MPNHISNLLVLDGPQEQVDLVLEHIASRSETCPGDEKYDKDDAGKIIPRMEPCPGPEHKSPFSGSQLHGVGTIDFGRIVPEPENIERGGCSGYHAPGVVCWYVWNREHWGTKWNAYSMRRIGTTGLYFETAWNTPEPVFHALVAADWFPQDVSLRVLYADEDMGHNLGYFEGTKGYVARFSLGKSTNLAGTFFAQFVAAAIRGPDAVAERFDWLFEAEDM
jgi:hypothetical protein